MQRRRGGGTELDLHCPRFSLHPNLWDQDLMTHYHLYTANNHLYTTKYHLYTTEYHLYSTEYHLYSTEYHLYTTALPRCRLYSNASQFIPESLSGMHGYLSLICLNIYWFSIVLETRIIFDLIQVKAQTALLTFIYQVHLCWY